MILKKHADFRFFGPKTCVKILARNHEININFFSMISFVVIYEDIQVNFIPAGDLHSQCRVSER